MARGLKLDNLRKVVLYGDVSAQEMACDEFRDLERAVEDEGSDNEGRDASDPLEGEQRMVKKKRKKRTKKKKKRQSVGHALSALISEIRRVGKAALNALLVSWNRLSKGLAHVWSAASCRLVSKGGGRRGRV